MNLPTQLVELYDEYVAKEVLTTGGHSATFSNFIDYLRNKDNSWVAGVLSNLHTCDDSCMVATAPPNTPTRLR